MRNRVLFWEGIRIRRIYMVASLYVSFPGSGLFQETCKVDGELGYIYIPFSPTLGESTEKQKSCGGAIVLRAAKKPLSRRQGLWALRISVTFSWARRYRPCRDKAQAKEKLQRLPKENMSKEGRV